MSDFFSHLFFSLVPVHCNNEQDFRFALLLLCPVLCSFVAALLQVQNALSSLTPVLPSDIEPVKFMNFSRGQSLRFFLLTIACQFGEYSVFLEPFPAIRRLSEAEHSYPSRICFYHDI